MIETWWAYKALEQYGKENGFTQPYQYRNYLPVLLHERGLIANPLIKLALYQLFENEPGYTYTSDTKQYYNIKRLVDRGLLTMLPGGLKLKQGRPLDAYCAFDVKRDNYVHDYQVSLIDVILARGDYTQRKNDWEADAIWTYGHKVYAIEYETGSKREAEKIEGRFSTYQTFSGDVLWIAATENHKQRLLNYSDSDIHYFTTFQQLSNSPFGEIFTGQNGGNYSIE